MITLVKFIVLAMIDLL